MQAMRESERNRLSTVLDEDPQETAGWPAAIQSVIEAAGPDRAHYLIEQELACARLLGQSAPHAAGA